VLTGQNFGESFSFDIMLQAAKYLCLSISLYLQTNTVAIRIEPIALERIAT
jgi:hypothetical protein